MYLDSRAIVSYLSRNEVNIISTVQGAYGKSTIPCRGPVLQPEKLAHIASDPFMETNLTDQVMWEETVIVLATAITNILFHPDRAANNARPHRRAQVPLTVCSL
jgi:hypothetical protein